MSSTGKNVKAELDRIKEERDLSVKAELEKKERDIARDKEVKEKGQNLLIRKEKRDAAAEKDWLRVEKLADEMMSRGMEGYNEWTTAMMNIVNGARALSEALRKTAPVMLLRDVVVIALVQYVKHPTIEKIEKTGIYETPLKPVLEIIGLQETPLKPLVIQVELDDAGTLDVSANYHNEPFNPQDTNVISAGVIAWAKTRGFELVRSNDNRVAKLVDSQTKEPMTPDVFKKINEEDELGLECFMSGRFNLNVDLHEPSRYSAKL